MNFELKEKELIEEINKCLSIKVGSDFIKKAMRDDQPTILYSICFSNKINFLPVLLWKHAPEKTSASMVNQMIDFALVQSEFVKNLSQEDIYKMITIPAAVCSSGQPRVVTAAFKQLKALNLLENKDTKKEAAKIVFKTILKYKSLHKTQEKLAKIWSDLGDFEDIEELLPAISKESEGCSVKEKKINFVEVDCNKIGSLLTKISEQKKEMRAFELLFLNFKKIENEKFILMEKIDENNNKINVIFEDENMSKRFKLLVDYYSSDVVSFITGIEKNGALVLEPIIKKTYDTLRLNDQLSNELKSNVSNTKKLKI